jgi:hypothetical protein
MRWGAIWMLTLAGCTLPVEPLPGACIEAYDAQQVCFDGTDGCQGDALDGSCADAGYTVAVEDCDALIAGTEGGYVEPGLCPEG